jgi:hypothetical protein
MRRGLAAAADLDLPQVGTNRSLKMIKPKRLPALEPLLEASPVGQEAGIDGIDKFDHEPTSGVARRDLAQELPVKQRALHRIRDVL